MRSTKPNGHSLPFWGDEKVLELRRGVAVQHCERISNTT